jgi:hypothetical protein
MFTEPLGGWRHVKAEEHRAKLDLYPAFDLSFLRMLVQPAIKPLAFPLQYRKIISLGHICRGGI